jgi:hypothetical protein
MNDSKPEEINNISTRILILKAEIEENTKRSPPILGLMTSQNKPHASTHPFPRIRSWASLPIKGKMDVKFTGGRKAA